ncbi:sigma factor [Altibacter sp. HG106]|uniref:sigma factor n=1 Tax=Altibacter sp. HG106 TaxID=3023937 RepID=UPI0023508573|nr:sigma factor [Altibacter sp. HG106]MDC7993527.1 sigma factor [Altibacter sp. HG106]
MYCDNKTHREDSFQEIVLQLWKTYSSFRGASKFSLEMYPVALNVAIQDFRKEKKRKYLFLERFEFKELVVYMNERIRINLTEKVRPQLYTQ